jgi:hypothetical protein
MKNEKMKKILSVMLLLFLANIASAQVSKTIDVQIAGTLNTLLTFNEKVTITNLKINGYVDARDIKFIRDEIRNLSILDLGSVTINGYEGNNGTSSYTTSYPMNSMPNSSFWSSEYGAKISLQTIILPNTLKSISSMAFIGCTGLISVTMSDSIISIGSNAFESCEKLSNINIPNSVITIGEYAFAFCSSLTEITIGSNVSKIENHAFYGCKNATSLNISNSVKSIEDYAFSNCEKLNSVVIPNSVEMIGAFSFSYCNNLSNLTIGSSVSNIENWAFSNCDKLKIINSLNTNPPILGSFVFSGSNSSVTNVYVPLLSVDTYKIASGWYNYFYPIISACNSTTGVQAITNNRIKVITTTTEIVIDGTVLGESVTIYTVNGQHIQTVKSKGEKLNLQVDIDAVYLVKIGEKIIKVIL